jgi:DNA-binding MarR family transcriptional regulator
VRVRVTRARSPQLSQEVPNICHRGSSCCERVATRNDPAQQLLTSQSGMTGKLDRLERQGLVQRSPDPADRRAIRLGITDAGRALIDEAFTTCLSVYQAMLDDFTPTEVKDFEALLEKLLTRLDQLSGLSQPWTRPG